MLLITICCQRYSFIRHARMPCSSSYLLFVFIVQPLLKIRSKLWFRALLTRRHLNRPSRYFEFLQHKLNQLLSLQVRLRQEEVSILVLIAGQPGLDYSNFFLPCNYRFIIKSTLYLSIILYIVLLMCQISPIFIIFWPITWVICPKVG